MVCTALGQESGRGSNTRRRGAQSWGYRQKSERKSRKGLTTQAVKEYGGAWHQGVAAGLACCWGARQVSPLLLPGFIQPAGHYSPTC